MVAVFCIFPSRQPLRRSSERFGGAWKWGQTIEFHTSAVDHLGRWERSLAGKWQAPQGPDVIFGKGAMRFVLCLLVPFSFVLP